MSALAERYTREYGDRAIAAEAFARDLMRGDPAKFKAGYSAANAAIATAETFDFGPQSDELATLFDAINVLVIDRATVRSALAREAAEA